MTATSHGTARALPRLRHRLPHRLPSASRVLPSFTCLEGSAFCVQPSRTSPLRSAPERSSTWVAPSSRRRSPRSADDVVTATSRVLPGLPTSCRRPLIGSGRTLTCLLPRTRARPSAAVCRAPAPIRTAGPQAPRLGGPAGTRRHPPSRPRTPGADADADAGAGAVQPPPHLLGPPAAPDHPIGPPAAPDHPLGPPAKPDPSSDRLRHPTPAPQASRPSRPGRPRHPAPAPQAPQPPLLEGDRQMITSRSDASAPGAAR